MKHAKILHINASTGFFKNKESMAMVQKMADKAYTMITKENKMKKKKNLKTTTIDVSAAIFKDSFKIIPKEKKKQHPSTVDESLLILQKQKYKSHGYGVLFLMYDFTFKNWSVCYRNPANFQNPKTKSKTPLQACHKMLDFIEKIKNKDIPLKTKKS